MVISTHAWGLARNPGYFLGGLAWLVLFLYAAAVVIFGTMHK